MIYILQLRKGIDPGKAINRILSGISNVFKTKPKVKLSYRKPPADDKAYNRKKNQVQERMNEILEKISKSGYDSLTKEEKEILFRSGK
jgi:hypothetical protein